MSTKALSPAYDSLPEDVKPTLLALSVLIDRIRSLSKADRDDLFDLLQEWRKADNLEDQRSIHRAMEEILAQIPMSTTQMPLGEESPLSGRLRNWAGHVGAQIKRLREQAGLTQVQLAEKAGIGQSHLCRLENAEHTPTSMTLEKIARALGVDPGKLDPCAE